MIKHIALTSLITIGSLLATSCANLIRPNFTQELIELKAGQYQLDKQHSYLNFRIGHLELSKIVGRFNDIDATLEFDPATPESLTLSGIVLAGSIDLNNKDLESTLQEPDWFNTEQFPQLIFDSTTVTAINENQFKVDGNLSMRGVTQEISLLTTFNGGADNLFTRKYTIGFSATTTLNRSDYGMDTFSAFVGDDIEVELHGEFLKQ